jgi:hypothetical protein
MNEDSWVHRFRPPIHQRMLKIPMGAAASHTPSASTISSAVAEMW